MLLATLAVVGIRVLADRYERTMTREELLDPSARIGRTDLDGPLNYLLVGSDRRPGDTGPEQRTDTILIVHVPAGLREGYLVSVPRDLLVTIPPGGGYPGGEDKINTAYEYGGGGRDGAQLLSATLARLTGIRFDGAALVDFAGLRNVIDLLGGIDLCVRDEVRSIHTDRVFHPGCQRMDGAQALDYVRQRYGLPGGDYDRQTHQQQLLGAMLARAGETRLRTDPVQLHRLIRAVGDSLTVDTNGVPVEDLLLALHGLATDGLRGVQVPSYPQMIDQVSYVRLDSGAEGLFEAVRGTRMPEWAGAHPRWVTRI
ncbi:LCP family protein [Micromonospora sp. WMMD1082]|uniref:LCP family protein n=1 Tax=Micromonospora sp. WMMD1082 TaxID=3016104 RepID=UPI0024177045|nr:LCP family protein [Micromonospora sp. WMMD1082]MDG4794639.1 LCP family protein [Micromonospora sp. WMMD1082]